VWPDERAKRIQSAGADDLDHRQPLVTFPPRREELRPWALRRYCSRHLRSGRAGRYEPPRGIRSIRAYWGGERSIHGSVYWARPWPSGENMRGGGPMASDPLHPIVGLAVA
jgi:hypothetical protein